MSKTICECVTIGIPKGKNKLFISCNIGSIVRLRKKLQIRNEGYLGAHYMYIKNMVRDERSRSNTMKRCNNYEKT